MIVFNDILDRLAAVGWSTYRLQKEKVLSNGVIMQLRAGKPITTTTLNVLCRLLDCQPGDLIAYSPDEQGE